jgi:hypothetical protein
MATFAVQIFVPAIEKDPSLQPPQRDFFLQAVKDKDASLVLHIEDKLLQPTCSSFPVRIFN